MAKRDNYYEVAFAAYLRAQQVPYVAVNETRRSLLRPDADGEAASLKNLDFIISPPDGPSWLVDIKGRLFPTGQQQKQYWKNWSTGDDLQSMQRWQKLLGEQFCPLLVFAYDVVGNRSPVPVEQLFVYRGHCYAFLAMRLADYVAAARQISSAWDTYAISVQQFRELAVEFSQLVPHSAAMPELAV